MRYKTRGEMMALNFNSLRDSIATLEKTLKIAKKIEMENLDKELFEAVRSGVIQNYEVCYESAWKAMKKWIEENVEEVDGVTRRALFIKAFENKLILDVEEWMLFHKARNSTSHVYEEETAEEVYAIAFKFVKPVKGLYEKLEVR